MNKLVNYNPLPKEFSIRDSYIHGIGVFVKERKDAHLLVLEGKVNFHINQEVYTLSEKQLFDFPKLVEHSGDALENSTFLIIR